MREKGFPLTPIVKGRPIFKRHLYITSALFVAIILVTTFILIQLAQDAIKDRINSEMDNIAEQNAQKLSERMQLARLQTSTPDRVTQRQQNDEQQNDEIKAYADSLISDQDEIL